MIPKANQDDIIFCEMFRNGNEKAFKHLFDKYYVPLCRYMFLFVKNEQDVEEMALDIFEYIWENRENFDIKTNFKSYIFQAGRNRCLNFIRDRKELFDINEEVMSLASDDNDRIEVIELNNLIEEAICQLPDKCRDVFVKSRFSNKTNKEIAESMNISIKTVEAQITKALRTIRKYIGEVYIIFFYFLTYMK